MARGKVPPPPPAAFELEGVRPSEYMESSTALYLILACLLIIHPPALSRSLIYSLAGACAAWNAAAVFGYEADGAAVLATLLCARALHRAYQLALTLLATFPLTISFPFVVHLIPRFSIGEESWFKADGATEARAAPHPTAPYDRAPPTPPLPARHIARRSSAGHGIPPPRRPRLASSQVVSQVPAVPQVWREPEDADLGRPLHLRPLLPAIQRGDQPLPRPVDGARKDGRSAEINRRDDRKKSPR